MNVYMCAYTYENIYLLFAYIYIYQCETALINKDIMLIACYTWLCIHLFDKNLVSDVYARVHIFMKIYTFYLQLRIDVNLSIFYNKIWMLRLWPRHCLNGHVVFPSSWSGVWLSLVAFSFVFFPCILFLYFSSFFQKEKKRNLRILSSSSSFLWKF